MGLELDTGDTERPPPARGLGWIPDEPGSLGSGPADALFSSAYAPARGALPRLSARILNQGGTSTCVPHAGETMAFDRAVIQGTVRRRGSVLFGYWHARPASERVLGGKGLRPSVWVARRNELGTCDEARWPFSEAAVDVEPSTEASRFAYDQGAHGEKPQLRIHRCADGPERGGDLRLALHATHPAMTGFVVNDAFREYRGGLWVYDGGAVGRHMLEAVAWDEDGIWYRNSWGEDWGVAPGFDAIWVADDGTEVQAPRGGFVHIGYPTINDDAVTSDAYAGEWAKSFSEDVPR